MKLTTTNVIEALVESFEFNDDFACRLPLECIDTDGDDIIILTLINGQTFVLTVKEALVPFNRPLDF